MYMKDVTKNVMKGQTLDVYLCVTYIYNIYIYYIYICSWYQYILGFDQQRYHPRQHLREPKSKKCCTDYAVHKLTKQKRLAPIHG